MAEHTDHKSTLLSFGVFIFRCPSEGETFTFELWVSFKGTTAPLSCGDVGLLTLLTLEATVRLQEDTFKYND